MKPSDILESFLRFIKKLIPKKIFSFLQPPYHYVMAFLAALWYGFPSKQIFIVGVTGTKGKTSTVGLIDAILQEAGFKTALSSTLRFKIGKESEKNTYKMTLPGRFFLQRFLRKAVKNKCSYAIIEMTSESVKQYRHKFVHLDTLIFTNIAPEHIESHGSFEKYLAAKLELAKAVEKSKKRPRSIIVNGDDIHGGDFLSYRAEEKKSFSIKDAEPFTLKKRGVDFTLEGKQVFSHLSGEFNLYNILAAWSFAKTQGIETNVIIRALSSFKGIPGRMEYIDEGQDFTVVVDYAHTPDSLEKVYETFQTFNKICVLGGTGGGRDRWKRPLMGEIAGKHCGHIILTDEDSYDEDPMEIIDEIKGGIMGTIHETIVDRRLAIRKAISLAKTGDAIIITGKGTDPYIMGPNGTKIPWSDANITREEIKRAQEKQ